MKLPKLISSQQEMSGGNPKLLAALGEALVEGFSDVGSIQNESPCEVIRR